MTNAKGVNYCEACQSGERLDLRRFFPFLGSKWGLAMNYPPPRHDLIIEPFAGSAGYSTSYHNKQVVLVEKDPILAELWRYLISSSKDDILGIPILDAGIPIAEVIQEPGAQYLVGFWIKYCGTSPSNKSLKDSRDGLRWNERIRSRIALQVDHIKHWTLIAGDYQTVENFDATWFIDPPYADRTGEMYNQKRSKMSEESFVDFCISRKGQIIICDSGEANYLPFESLYSGFSRASLRPKHEQCVFYLDSN